MFVGKKFTAINQSTNVLHQLKNILKVPALQAWPTTYSGNNWLSHDYDYNVCCGIPKTAESIYRIHEISYTGRICCVCIMGYSNWTTFHWVLFNWVNIISSKVGTNISPSGCHDVCSYNHHMHIWSLMTSLFLRSPLPIDTPSATVRITKDRGYLVLSVYNFGYSVTILPFIYQIHLINLSNKRLIHLLMAQQNLSFQQGIWLHIYYSKFSFIWQTHLLFLFLCHELWLNDLNHINNIIMVIA